MTGKLEREALVDVAMGYEPADKVIVNGQIVNVHTGHIQRDDVAVKGSHIAALGEIGYTIGPETEVIDAMGQFLVPGLIDPHTHQWHTYTNSTVFAAIRLLHGCTTIADGFYGHAIVNGIKAVRFFLDELLATPVKPIFLVPTMCYTQNRALGFPNSPNAPTIEELFEMLNWPENKGVSETSYDLILQRERRDTGLLRLIEECLRQGKVPTGSCAGLSDDHGLNAWTAAGPMNDHECVSFAEAKRKAELGVYILIREGVGVSNDIRQVLPLITQRGCASRAFQICTDVTATEWALEHGQMDHAIRVAIRNGLDPIRAIQMSTIQPSEFFRVNHKMGVIAPGRLADIVFVEHLADFRISRVMANGQVWVEEDKLIRDLKQPEYPKWLYETMNISRVLREDDFRVAAPTGTGKTTKVRVITVQENSAVTLQSIETLPVVNGAIEADPSQGINKIAMVDRIFGTGEIGVAFIKGFNIRDGCIGQTANVFNQNILLVGASEQDMAIAGNEAITIGGGFTAARNGRVVATFPTPLNGLVSDLPFAETINSLNDLLQAWRELGCPLEAPQLKLELVSMVDIPMLRITTKGLAIKDGDRYELVSIVV